MSDRPAIPQRQNSTISTTSSGGRTVRANGRRCSSASSQLPSASSGLFAKLTGKPSTDYFSDSDSTPQDTDQEGQSGDQDPDGQGRGNGNAEAGPSDYWRRSPSPPRPPVEWRMKSDSTWSDDIEEGNYDSWRPHDSPGTGPFTPPFKMQRNENRRPQDEMNETVQEGQGIGTPDVNDEGVYERRLRDVFEADSPGSLRSVKSGGELSIDGPHTDITGLGDKRLNVGSKTGTYETAYREVLEEKDTGGIGEEEFGTFNSHVKDDFSDATPSSVSASVSGRPVAPSPLRRNVTPYLHPSVSRLRSHLRTASSTTQDSSGGLAGRPGHARIPSQFSQISLTRSASASTLSALPAPPTDAASPDQSPAFNFHPLRRVSAHLFSKRSSGSSSPARPAPMRKTSAQGVPALIFSGEDTSTLGRPTVLDVRGMVAVGTEGGYVVVYSFGQEIKHVLGTEATAKSSGGVTAVTISSDSTYIAVGHASGNIYLYDLSNPVKPARTTLALTLKQVMSGRKEGHLQGSRILHVAFVGARHTSIVSADEHGRAFWWSLGKVIGVESNDVVRMLGSYPEADAQAINGKTTLSSYPSKRPTTLFGAAPLPLGDKPHDTDMFNLTALLTPVKLVVVGMKPNAKTWFRKMRNDIGGQQGGVTGCISWLKSGELDDGSDPVLAYSWGSHVRFLRVKTSVVSPVDATAKEENVLQFVEGLRFDAPNTVAALQWYDANHLLILTTSEIVLLDVRTGQEVETTSLQTRLLTANDYFSGLGARRNAGVIPEALAGSVRIYRGKLFLLTRSNIQVGTLLHWNDRILARVHAGDFLGAIQVALSYYNSEAKGNYINLPETKTARQGVVGARTRELMRASLEWAFSEDRMRDDTQYTPDGRGVDLTSLFEGLASCCIEACLSLGDLNFLFDDAYEAYSAVGINGIFLSLLEPYIFDGQIRDVPPTIVKALISLHQEKGEFDLAEGVIWHVEPIALDINQAVTLCEKHGLWDALIHVYTRAMKDYTAPLVKLINLVADLDEQRRARLDRSDDSFTVNEEGAIDAYKIFAYIEAILSGVSYPSSENLPPQDGHHARSEVYGFIFSDRLAFWPDDQDGQLVLPQCGDTAYPYLDLLLRFDMEAFLHSMDIAFEDSYLNDAKAPFSRQTIINMMLDRMDPSIFHSGDITLLYIFVSRNLPKYPQFLFIPPSTLQHILLSLAEDPDQSTREDRQLAAEYLLSAYTPADFDKMLTLFASAGFWRILRVAYRREKQWAPLIQAYVEDPDIDDEIFEHIDEVIQTSRTKSGIIKEVVKGVESATPALLNMNIRQTALLIDHRLPELHNSALDSLRLAEYKRMAYLRCLLQPVTDEDDRGFHLQHASIHLDLEARHDYVRLLAEHESSALISFLDQVGPNFFDVGRLGKEFEDKRIYEAQIWAIDAQGSTNEAIDTARDIVRIQGIDLAAGLIDGSTANLHVALGTLDDVVKISVRICKAHSLKAKTSAGSDAQVEDCWYGVLHELLEVDHELSSILSMSTKTAQQGEEVAERIRSLVTETLTALVASSSAHLSFPRLFKRLVDTSDDNPDSNGKTKRGRHYAQFRNILGGMLDSYRAESHMLVMTTRLVQDDLFDAYKQLTTKKQSGWRTAKLGCAGCGEDIVQGIEDGKDKAKAKEIVRVKGNGIVWHVGCEQKVQ